VLLALETLACGRKVIVSRGELVEIGGAFRIPDVMARSGSVLVEVGTTNRTHFDDYQGAIDGDTALLLKVHKSNYSVMGFTAEVPLADLVALGKETGLQVMEDLGSGVFIDLSRYGLIREPTVQDSVTAGADVVTFSGDKLLGGPQAGLIVGKRPVLDAIKKNPITRALRIDKMTLAALEATLRLYRDPEKAVATLPTLKALTMAYEELCQRAEELAEGLAGLNDDRLTVECLDLSSRVGGGSLPLQELPSRCVGVRVSGFSANEIEAEMRASCPPVIGRIEEDRFIMDPRTLQEEEGEMIRDAFGRILGA
jgi:L-seryl-tRNA(Ser) seleniumtransferase